MNTHLLRCALVACIALVCAACPPRRPTGSMPSLDTPPALLPISAFPGDVMLEQHVTARYRDRENGFDAVLQKRGDVLTLVGLGPMGSVGFVVTVTDEGVTLQNDSGHDVPFSPAHIIADVQRVFYPWIEGTPPTDGTRSGAALETTITERYVGGHLIERRFTRADLPDRDDLVITYEGWTLGAIAPTHVLLVNGWYGYALEIETSNVVVPSAPATP